MAARRILLGGALAATVAALINHYVTRIQKARAWLGRGATIVDVDLGGSFAREHPRVAVNIPLEDLVRREHELGPVHKPIIVLAHRWRRGAQAVHELHKLGFIEVMNGAGTRTRDKLSAEASRAATARMNAEVLRAGEVRGDSDGQRGAEART